MDHIVLTGCAGPRDSFLLHQRLEPLTAALRPMVTVDLSAVDDMHPSVASVLIRQRRQARRQGGALHIVVPSSVAGTEVLSQIGLIGAQS